MINDKNYEILKILELFKCIIIKKTSFFHNRTLKNFSFTIYGGFFKNKIIWKKRRGVSAALAIVLLSLTWITMS